VMPFFEIVILFIMRILVDAHEVLDNLSIVLFNHPLNVREFLISDLLLIRLFHNLFLNELLLLVLIVFLI
jgi:hypothetical protein